MNFACSTVRAPWKKKDRKPNQDALKFRIDRNSFALCVADGFGSAVHSEIGSKAAAESVMESFKIWRRSKVLKTEDLIRMIHAVWSLRILPYSASDCNTTCVFAAAEGNRIYAGKIGDGLFLYNDNINKNIHILNSEKEFSNQTEGFASVQKISDWDILECDLSEDFSLMLCTDGISDDLENGKENDFMEHLIRELEALSGQKRTSYLKKELKNWPVPFHSDDKTIALGWRRK